MCDMTDGKDEFAARVAKIAAGGIGTKGTIYVGQNETYNPPPPRARPQQSKAKEIATNALYPAGLAGAFLLGMFAVAFGRYVRFQAFSGMRFDGDLEMAVNGAMGLCVAFVLSQMFRLADKEHLALQSMGVLVMVCTFHNLVHWMPTVATQLFSPEWVADMRATTEPNSIRFRGATFLLTPPASDAPESAEVEPRMQHSEAAATEMRAGAKFLSLPATPQRDGADAN